MNPTSKSLRCFKCYAKHHLNNLGRCGKCRVAQYCSKSCQKRDWPDHKLHCEDLKDYVVQENEKIRLLSLERPLSFGQIKDRKREISRWVESTPFPDERQVKTWLDCLLDEDEGLYKWVVGQGVCAVKFGSKENQMKMFKYEYIREIYEGNIDAYNEDPMVHYGRIRQVGWKISDKWGVDGMLFYYYLNMWLLDKMSGEKGSGLSQSLMYINVEKVWDRVGEWLK